MNTKEQLQEVSDKLAQLDPNNRDNLVEIASLEQKRDLLKMQIADETSKAEQEAAQKVVIQEATVKADNFLANFEIEGLTLSQLSASADACELLRNGIQIKLVEQEGQAAANLKLQEMTHAEELRARDDRELQLQRQNDELQKKLDFEEEQAQLDAAEHAKHLQQIAQLEQSNRDIQAESNDFQSKLKNATDEIDRLNSHIDDLRKEIAVGAQQAYKVVDMEGTRKQMSALAEKIKASRIHVYDVVPDADFNPKNFTAKRADTGETITYNWTTANNYIELKDEEEVSQFRQQHAEQNAIPNPALDTPIEVPAIPAIPEVIPVQEVQFQGEVHPVPVTVVKGVSITNGTVSREEFEALKATVNELCEVCNIAEVA